MRRMAMGKRKRDRQPPIWVTITDLPTAASHPFYRRLNQLLREHGFDAFAERFVESAKSECLDRMVLLGEGHLRGAVREFVDYYHKERPHQGLGNKLIAPHTTVIGIGPMKCRERLGGLLKFYYREAA
jgi:transposase InsO family protein